MEWRWLKKRNSELSDDGKEKASSEENLNRSSLKEEDPITQEEEFKKPTKPMMSINVMTQKQKLLALCNTPPHDLGRLNNKNNSGCLVPLKS
eukprot:12511811-Ditylum_brightwellii.AAC.1